MFFLRAPDAYGDSGRSTQTPSSEHTEVIDPEIDPLLFSDLAPPSVSTSSGATVGVGGRSTSSNTGAGPKSERCGGRGGTGETFLRAGGGGEG